LFKNMKEFFNKYPFLLVTLIIVLFFWFAWWMSQPIEFIYDADAPPYPYGNCDRKHLC